MGYYVICGVCGCSDKNKYPDCDCRQKEWKRITEMIIGSQVIDMYIDHNILGISIYTHYRREGYDFYIESVHDDDGDHYSSHQLLLEISKENYEEMKSVHSIQKESEEEKESI